MSPFFLLGRALEFSNGEIFIQWKKWKMVKNNNVYSLKRLVEWPIEMMLEGSKEKRGFSRENSCSITIL
jgi:hypothetical protein